MLLRIALTLIDNSMRSETPKDTKAWSTRDFESLRRYGREEDPK